MTDPRLRRRLVEEALRQGYNLSGEALRILESMEDPLGTLRRVLERLREEEPEAIVVEERHLETVRLKEGVEATSTPGEGAIILHEEVPEVIVGEEYLREHRIEGRADEFKQYFMDRYGRLKAILGERMSFQTVMDARRLRKEQEATLALMLLEKRETEKALMIEAEDETGIIRLVVPRRAQKTYEEAARILPDSVFAAKVRRMDNIYIAQEIHLPDIPLTRDNSEGPDLNLCLISDLHVGSKKFRKDLFESFLDWINRGRDGEVRRIRYLLIAGDLVDGIGIFPGQRWELEETSVKRQLEQAAELLSEIPGHIKVIFSTGNHEPVEKALPQPPLQGEHREVILRRREVILVGNPARIEIGGRTILVYHGQGLDDIIQALPDVSYNTLQEDAGKLLRTLLQHRHLSPVYGENTPILPLPRDYLVIEEPPHILHTGHIHVAHAENYRGVRLINTGAWQEQTSYQKSVGLQPTVGTMALVSLRTLEVKLRKFT